jgi:DNA-directed RNA polymerase subunit M
MRFCDECGSMMHTEGDTWVCRSCENEEPRDSRAEATTTRSGRRDDRGPAVADATRDFTETVQEPCPADDCDGDRAYYETIPKPSGSYEVRLFTCIACGHKWRESRRRISRPLQFSVHRPPPPLASVRIPITGGVSRVYRVPGMFVRRSYDRPVMAPLRPRGVTSSPRSPSSLLEQAVRTPSSVRIRRHVSALG